MKTLQQFINTTYPHVVGQITGLGASRKGNFKYEVIFYADVNTFFEFIHIFFVVTNPEGIILQLEETYREGC